MLTWIREKFGTVLIGGVIGFIAFVFTFYGVFSPKSTRGLHDGAVAGTVNGDPIPLSEYNRALNQRMEFFKNLGGGKISEEQLKQFHIRESVFQDLVRRKVMAQEAERLDMMASDEEVRERIKEIPAFQKEGKFDVGTYKQVLEANNYSPGSFERMVREDISLQQWDTYFRNRVHVSEVEARRQFEVSQDKRNIKYVLLTPESAKGQLKIGSEDVKKFLADPAKTNLAKSQYEARKETEFKGLKFEDIKEQIAHDILAGEKIDELRKINEQLAEKVVSELTADKGSDARINALLKPYKVTVKTTGFISRANTYIPGIGDAKELLADVFAPKSPVDPGQGGKAKKYSSAQWVLVAVVTESQRPDPSKFDTEREGIVKQLSSKKERELYEDWLRKLTTKAKIDTNPSVVNDGAEG